VESSDFGGLLEKSKPERLPNAHCWYRWQNASVKRNENKKINTSFFILFFKYPDCDG
jgi:hypothetical protein